MRLRAAPLLLLLAAVPARAQDTESADHDKPQVEGELRAGWRLMHDEDDGRFPQDQALQGGPRLFDLAFRAFGFGDGTPLTEVEGEAFGVGDATTDYRMKVRGGEDLGLSGGWSRDDYSYRSTGDPFPLDSRREHGFAEGRMTVGRDLEVRLAWDRRTRRGESFTSFDTDLRDPNNPPPPGVDEDLVRDRRPLDQRFDVYTLAVNGGHGIFRYGVTQTFDVRVIDDERYYDIPSSRNPGTPVREAFRRQIRSTGYTTVGKGGVSLLDGDLEFNAFLTVGRVPVDGRISGDREGFDGGFSGGSPKGDFTSTVDGDTRTRRSISGWRGEAVWKALPDLEIIAGAEEQDIVDDASLDTVEVRSYGRLDVPDDTIRQSTDARITDRADRWSLEALWDATDELTFRGGYEFFRHDLSVPTDTPGASLEATRLRTEVTRWTAGVDARPVKGLTLSVLGRVSDDDEPHANTSFQDGDEAVVRARWRATDELFLTTVFRLKDYESNRDFNSSTKARTLSGSATWTRGPLTVTATGTFQDFDTHSATTYLELAGGFRVVGDTLVFRSRDAIGDLDATYELTKRLRLRAHATVIDTDGDYEAWSHDLGLGAEYDVRPDVTLGAELRAWRLDERSASRDDYSVEALELWVGYRF